MLLPCLAIVLWPHCYESIGGAPSQVTISGSIRTRAGRLSHQLLLSRHNFRSTISSQSPFCMVLLITCSAFHIPPIFHKTLIGVMRIYFSLFQSCFISFLSSLRWNIQYKHEKISHEFVLSQRKGITHGRGKVRLPVTLRGNRKETCCDVSALAKLLTKGQGMTVNQEIALYVYTHSFSILCWYTIERTSKSDLAPQSGAAHSSTAPPIRNPSSESVLSLRGGLASIALETGFPSFLRLSEGG